MSLLSSNERRWLLYQGEGQIYVRGIFKNTLSPYHDAWQLLHLYALVALETLGPVLAALALLAIVVFLSPHRSCAIWQS